MIGRIPHPRFVSLRSRLFVAFVGVLLLSSILTGAAFWRQISASDARQVQSDLLSSAPSVFTQVKKDLDPLQPIAASARLHPERSEGAHRSAQPAHRRRARQRLPHPAHGLL